MSKQTVKVRTSWAVQEVTYDDSSQTLTVHMQEGSQGQGKYLRYSPVPLTVFNEFVQAESKGKFFNSRIRNTYPYIS
jgi:hypothetical protein